MAIPPLPILTVDHLREALRDLPGDAMVAADVVRTEKYIHGMKVSLTYVVDEKPSKLIGTIGVRAR